MARDTYLRGRGRMLVKLLDLFTTKLTYPRLTFVLHNAEHFKDSVAAGEASESIQIVTVVTVG
jgi:hypothetical protein